MFGHMMDMGGPLPGSLPTGAKTVYGEAMMIPPVKIFRKGEPVNYGQILADATLVSLMMTMSAYSGRMVTKQFVLEQFVRLLARQPTDKELTTFVNALKTDPAVTPEVVLYTLISSPEYQSY